MKTAQPRSVWRLTSGELLALDRRIDGRLVFSWQHEVWTLHVAPGRVNSAPQRSFRGRSFRSALFVRRATGLAGRSCGRSYLRAPLRQAMRSLPEVYVGSRFAV